MVSRKISFDSKRQLQVPIMSFCNSPIERLGDEQLLDLPDIKILDSWEPSGACPAIWRTFFDPKCKFIFPGSSYDKILILRNCNIIPYAGDDNRRPLRGLITWHSVLLRIKSNTVTGVLLVSDDEALSDIYTTYPPQDITFRDGKKIKDHIAHDSWLAMLYLGEKPDDSSTEGIKKSDMTFTSSIPGWPSKEARAIFKKTTEMIWGRGSSLRYPAQFTYYLNCPLVELKLNYIAAMAFTESPDETFLIRFDNVMQ